MSLMSETSEPVSKRSRSENDHCGSKLCEDERENIQERTKDVPDTRENFLEELQEQRNDERIADSDDETSAVIDSDESFVFPPDNDISDMLDEVEYSGHFPTVTDRYFTPYYKMDVQSPADDMCIHVHSNRICMLSLAPSHVIFQGDRDITKIDFKVSNKLDRALNKVSGKSKHGAQPLQINSNICIVTCSDGQTYLIKCCMIGKLVEVNEMLLEKPQLLKKPPHRGGYLAIILPNIKLLENLKQSLLTHKRYIELVKEREQQYSIKNEEASETHSLQSILDKKEGT